MRQQKSGGKISKKAHHIASDTPDEATSYKSNYPFFFGSNYKSDHIGDVSLVEQNSKKDNIKVRVPGV